MHWHFIGQIQTNKLAIINKYSTTIHSISRIKEIDILKKLDKTIDIFIQIKKDQSEQRSAALISKTPQLLVHVKTPYQNNWADDNAPKGNQNDTEQYFIWAKQTFDTLQRQYPYLTVFLAWA